jgi:hypothetical protein
VTVKRSGIVPFQVTVGPKSAGLFHYSFTLLATTCKWLNFMEKLLAIEGISTITAYNSKGDQFKYNYTEKMRLMGMFIESYEHEYVPEEDDETTYKIVKFEKGLGVILYYNSVAYHFMMLNDVKPQANPTQQAVQDHELYQMILDLVNTIESSPIDELIALLRQSSIDTFTSLEFEDEPELQKDFHDMILKKIRTLQNGIEESRLAILFN